MPYKSREDQYANHAKIRQNNFDNMWKLLLERSCVDCGIEDSRVLEFDHLPEFEKKFDVARAVSGSTRSWNTILNEINKCEVVCSNCHKIRTMTRGNFNRHKATV
jgi:hypothetical protein